MGSVSSGLVAVEARKAIEHREAADDSGEADFDGGGGGQADDAHRDEGAPGAKVISPLARRLPPDARTAPTDMSEYEQPLKPVTRHATTKGTSV
ncbi:hypothetical protein ACFWOT_04055 [Streptomyces sp. NPDC058440]|uniref:hypothetical protein n=1 Tax=Streptomyces sp. NPDC058440 TaxID=3346501 RepID=UPI0036478628